MKRVVYREHRGGLVESMATRQYFPDVLLAIAYLKSCGAELISPYGDGKDDRINWTHLLIVSGLNGNVMGFLGVEDGETEYRPTGASTGVLEASATVQ